MCIAGQRSQARLTKRALTDLRWFARLGAQETGLHIWDPSPTAVLETDSSSFGWGAVLRLEGLEPLEARGFWSRHERRLHINVLEVMAVTRAVQSFGTTHPGLVARSFIDSQAALGAVRRLTSPSAPMMEAVRGLQRELESCEWELQAEWISTLDNHAADALSREEDTTDWALSPEIFALFSRLTLFTVDRFATELNAMLPRFNSRWLCPGTEAVDSLKLADSAWAEETNWCNPPWPLLPSLVAKLRSSQARAAVVAPYWPSALWRPVLLGW